MGDNLRNLGNQINVTDSLYYLAGWAPSNSDPSKERTAQSGWEQR
jgi:hypothetical protein